VVSCGEFQAFWGIAPGFAAESLVAADENRAFSVQNTWTICGE
jgi:hypothetical protein